MWVSPSTSSASWAPTPHHSLGSGYSSLSCSPLSRASSHLRAFLRIFPSAQNALSLAAFPADFYTYSSRESSAHVFMRPPDWATSLRFTHTSNWSAVYFVGSQSTHTHTHLWSLIYAGLYYTAGYLSFPRHQAHSRGSRWACLQNGRTKWLADVACYNPG